MLEYLNKPLKDVMQSQNFAFNPKKILVPIDLSEEGKAALYMGLDLVKRFNSSLRALIVVERWPRMPYVDKPAMSMALTKNARQQVKDVISQFKLNPQQRRNVQVVTRQGRPAQVISGLARGQFFDFVIMASHGRLGVARLQNGSVTEEVIQNCKAPVLVFKPQFNQKVFQAKKVLVPLDGSLRDLNALAMARALQETVGSKVMPLQVIPQDRTPDPAYGKAIAHHIAQMGIQEPLVTTTGEIAERILHTAHESATELILLSARSKRINLTGPLGSVSTRVVRHAQSDVLILNPRV